jgi:hypothetical protein
LVAVATQVPDEHAVVKAYSALKVGSACLAATLVPDLLTAYLTNEYLPFHDGDIAFAHVPGAPTTHAATAASAATTQNLGRIASMVGVR